MLPLGCCGFPVAMQTCFNRFRVVEIQQTFYQPPLLSTIQKWRNEAPPDFELQLLSECLPTLYHLTKNDFVVYF
ncbi:MAG: DUF72 domain-containing protein [Candidatus Brocadia sp.]|nr:DUF72 domain-containing protein [Candidatus Brocadia sp.]